MGRVVLNCGASSPGRIVLGASCPDTPPFDDRGLSVIFLQNNNEMLSFAKSFSFKVEGMCLQHLPTLSLKVNEPDGLQIEENLGKSKRHFFAWKNTELKRCPFCPFVLIGLVLSLLALKSPF